MNKPTPFSTYRKNSGQTLERVAEVFKVNRTTILRWEKGEPPVPVKRLSEVEKVTGIPRWELRPDVFKGAGS